jgi:fluoride exporter
VAALAALRRRLALLAVIGAGGATGTAARYGTELAMEPGSDAYPVDTFLVNVVGAVILGAVAELPREWLLAHELTGSAISTGFCGGLTTFSTMSLEINGLWPAHPEIATAYAAASLAAAIACARAGSALVQTVRAIQRSRRPPRPRSEGDKI